MKAIVPAVLILASLVPPAAGQAPDRAYLERLVAEPVSFATPADSVAVAKLRDACAKLAAGGELAGTQVMTFDDVMKFYCNPGRSVYAASLCLPLLDDAGRAQLQPVVRRALEAALSEEGLASAVAGQIAGGPAATPQRYAWSGNTAALWDAALAADAYGRATGDWATAEALWPNLRKAIVAAPRTEQSLFWTNLEHRHPAHALEAAGCIAAIRLAERFGDRGLANGLYAKLGEAAARMLAEVDAADPDVPERTRLGEGRHSLMYFPYLHYATPETMRILRDHRREAITAILAGFEQRHPWHHLNSFNHGMEGSGEEGMFQPPWVAFQAYQAKAFVCSTPRADLVHRLPWPNAWATMRSYQDPFYLQNLWTLAAAEAGALD